jgi:hypothetical protein
MEGKVLVAVSGEGKRGGGAGKIKTTAKKRGPLPIYSMFVYMDGEQKPPFQS